MIMMCQIHYQQYYFLSEGFNFQKIDFFLSPNAIVGIYVE